jgi:hypothetical protein
MSVSHTVTTQNELLLNNLMCFYKDKTRLLKMMGIINGESNISLRIVDWFVTNYAKMYFTIYDMPIKEGSVDTFRFKVYQDYKLKLKAYSKKRFDPFCRWERITVPYDESNFIETTIGQLNFFKWAIENRIIDYIQENYDAIEKDMNERNSTSKTKQSGSSLSSSSTDSSGDNSKTGENNKTRKKREELSISACKCIKKENVKIIVKFS